MARPVARVGMASALVKRAITGVPNAVAQQYRVRETSMGSDDELCRVLVGI